MQHWVRQMEQALREAVFFERIGNARYANDWLQYALYCERRAGRS